MEEVTGPLSNWHQHINQSDLNTDLELTPCLHPIMFWLAFSPWKGTMDRVCFLIRLIMTIIYHSSPMNWVYENSLISKHTFIPIDSYLTFALTWLYSICLATDLHARLSKYAATALLLWQQVSLIFCHQGDMLSHSTSTSALSVKERQINNPLKHYFYINKQLFLIYFSFSHYLLQMTPLNHISLIRIIRLIA